MDRWVMGVAGLALLYLGGQSHWQAHEWRGRAAALERSVSQTDGWGAAYVAAAAPESLAWRRVETDLHGLGSNVSKLDMARRLSRQAESAGLTDVRVTFTGGDTRGLVARPSIGRINFKPAPYGLVIEFHGSVQAAARFVDSLPRATAIVKLELMPKSGATSLSRLELAMFEVNTDATR